MLRLVIFRYRSIARQTPSVNYQHLIDLGMLLNGVRIGRRGGGGITATAISRFVNKQANQSGLAMSSNGTAYAISVRTW